MDKGIPFISGWVSSEATPQGKIWIPLVRWEVIPGRTYKEIGKWGREGMFRASCQNEWGDIDPCGKLLGTRVDTHLRHPGVRVLGHLSTYSWSAISWRLFQRTLILQHFQPTTCELWCPKTLDNEMQVWSCNMPICTEEASTRDKDRAPCICQPMWHLESHALAGRLAILLLS